MMIDWITPSTALLGIFVPVLGSYFLGHRAGVKKKRHDLTIEYLVDAYRVIAHDYSNREMNVDIANKLEGVLSDIQLFGSPSQIEKTVEMIEKTMNNQGNNPIPDLNSLLLDLRNDLRKQLKLKKTDKSVLVLRLSKK